MILTGVWHVCAKSPYIYSLNSKYIVFIKLVSCSTCCTWLSVWAVCGPRPLGWWAKEPNNNNTYSSGHFPAPPRYVRMSNQSGFCCSEMWWKWQWWQLELLKRAKLHSDHHHQHTITQSIYRLDALPVIRPTVSKCQSTEGKSKRICSISLNRYTYSDLIFVSFFMS